MTKIKKEQKERIAIALYRNKKSYKVDDLNISENAKKDIDKMISEFKEKHNERNEARKTEEYNLKNNINTKIKELFKDATTSAIEKLLILENNLTEYLVSGTTVPYSRKYYYTRKIKALVVFDKDNKSWSVLRVPEHIETIESAREYLKPAEVKRAKKVERQGDIYFIPAKRKMRNTELGRHKIKYTEGKTIVLHPQHSRLELAGIWKGVHQKTSYGINLD